MTPQISEIWEIQIGKKKYRISGKEKAIIIGAGETRFVQFRDLVVNPAFVSDMVLIERTSDAIQLDKPEETISEEQHKKLRAKIDKFRREKVKTMSKKLSPEEFEKIRQAQLKAAESL